MVDTQIVLEWLIKADEDFEFAQINLEEQRSFYAQICFHFQQSAEKYLKAYIVAYELAFRKVHELPMLLKTCLLKDSSFEELNDDCEFLTTFYIETRYPVHWPTQFSQTEAEKCLEAARKIRDFVRERLRDMLRFS